MKLAWILTELGYELSFCKKTTTTTKQRNKKGCKVSLDLPEVYFSVIFGPRG